MYVLLQREAGNTVQGQYSIAIGHQAGYTDQVDHAVSIGFQAGNDNQGSKIQTKWMVGTWVGESQRQETTRCRLFQ